jgi:hypothetical protein
MCAPAFFPLLLPLAATIVPGVRVTVALIAPFAASVLIVLLRA